MLLYSNFKWTYVQHTTPCYSFLIISQGGLSYNFYFWFLESEVIFLGQSYQSKSRLEYSAAHDWPSSNWLKVSASTTLDCKAIAVCFSETISLWHIFFFFYNTRFNWTASTLVLFLYKLWLHVTVKSPSCRNYITVCGGFSEFWMQVGNVNFCLCSQTHVPFYNKQIADSTSFTCKLLANWCHLNALKLPWKWQLTATISKATAPCQWLCSLTWL